MDPVTPTSITSPDLQGRAAPRLDQPKPVDPQAAKLHKLRRATSDFEALFLANLLKPLEKSLSQSSGGSNLGGDVMFGVAITKMAESIAHKSGVGLGDMLYKNMEPRILAEMDPAADSTETAENGGEAAKVHPLRKPDAGPIPLPDDSPVIPFSAGSAHKNSDKTD